GEQRFDGVLIPSAGTRAVKETFQRGWTKGKCEFAGVARNRLAGKVATGIKRISVISGTESGGSGYAKPITEMNRNGDFGSKLRAGHEIRRADEGVVAVNRSGERREREIDRQVAPGCLLHGPEAHLRRSSEKHAIGR